MDNLFIKIFQRTKAKFIIVIFPLIILSCSSTPLPGNGSVTVPEDFFGMVHAGEGSTPEEYQLINEMEIQWVLYSFRWNYIESIQGSFDFSYYDGYVDVAKSEGKKIVGAFVYDNWWLYPDAKMRDKISAEHIPDFLNYVEKTLLHFQGRVDVWEIWNEPNNNMFWKGTDKEFFELTKATAQRIKEVDPNAYVLGGAFWMTPAGFIKNMHNAGAMENIDAIAFHPYALNPSDSMKLYDKFLKVLSEINFTRPVWITEIGYPTGGVFPLKISNEALPSYVIKTIAGSAARGARVMLWYQLIDAYNIDDKLPSDAWWNIGHFYGLAYPNYQRKNGAWAYELCARYLPGSRYEPEFPARKNIPSNIVTFCFMRGITGDNTLILWNDNNSFQKVQLTLSGFAYLNDITTGIRSPLSGDIILDIGNQPLFITWQGQDIPHISGLR